MKGTSPILTPMRRLPEQARAARPGADAMLLCPLALQDRPSGDLPTGLIAVFGGQRVLSDLTVTFDLLAHQVALTLESVLLRQEVIRQRNEAYFRALVQDASDAIVIVDDDGTIKYATRRPARSSVTSPRSASVSGTWSRRKTATTLPAPLCGCGNGRGSARAS